MNTEIKLTKEPKKLLDAMSAAKIEEINLAWSTIRDEKLVIYPKIKQICYIFGVDFEETVDCLPKDDTGRLLDKKSRHYICQQLVQLSHSKV
jgi:hypothetical protein